MAEPRPATTLLLLREVASESGLEVFMVRRHRRSGFLPHAWVFPGGRVEERDRLDGHVGLRGGEDSVARLPGLDRGTAVAFLVAGVRETFEECGIWLGSGALPDDVREPLASGAVDLPQLLADHGASVDLDRLRVWSWWITPEAEPRRYDTRFLVAHTPGALGTHDETETVDSGWFDPAVVLEHKLEAFPMAPPTWWTLHQLLAAGSVDEVMRRAQRRPQHPVQPILEFTDGMLELFLPGHPRHPEPPVPEVPARIAFEDGRWVAHLPDDSPG